MGTDKIMIFGTGNMLIRNISNIDLSNVLAFIDNNEANKNNMLYDKLIIKPEMIVEYKYDYIVIFNKHNIGEIYNQLVNELNLPKEKIVNWQYYIYIQNYKVKLLSNYLIYELPNIISCMELKNILDVDFGFIKMNMLTKSEYEYGIDVWDIYETSKPIYLNLYDEIETKIEHLSKEYDALLMLDYFLEHTLEEGLEVINITFDKTRYIIITIPYSCPDNFTEWNMHDFSQYGYVRKSLLDTTQLLIIDKKSNIKVDETNIFVVTHKDFTPPNNKAYIPIHAGKKISYEMGFEGDDTGDNISELNPLLNECTVLYWLWKNVDCKYIGLNHYRRYLLKNMYYKDLNNILNYEDIKHFMKFYDIVTGEIVSTYPYTVAEHLHNSLCDEAFEFGYNCTREIISKKYPEYLMTYDEFFNGHVFYPCNLFITRKEVMNQYCEWLFGILFEIVKKVDISNYDNYSKRIIGFMAERLFTVWLINSPLKIKELSILNTELI